MLLNTNLVPDIATIFCTTPIIAASLNTGKYSKRERKKPTFTSKEVPSANCWAVSLIGLSLVTTSCQQIDLAVSL